MKENISSTINVKERVKMFEDLKFKHGTNNDNPIKKKKLKKSKGKSKLAVNFHLIDKVNEEVKDKNEKRKSEFFSTFQNLFKVCIHLKQKLFIRLLYRLSQIEHLYLYFSSI
jgi:hypothetical protein